MNNLAKTTGVLLVLSSFISPYMWLPIIVIATIYRIFFYDETKPVIPQTKLRLANQSDATTRFDYSQDFENLIHAQLETRQPWVDDADFKAYYSSPVWRRKRLDRILFDRCKCQDCGLKLRLSTASVHHTTYARFQHELISDLLTLCYNCHCNYHPHMKRRTNGIAK